VEVQQAGGHDGFPEKAGQGREKHQHAEQKAQHRIAMAVDAVGLAQEQQGNGQADAKAADGQQPYADIGQPAALAQKVQFREAARDEVLFLRVAQQFFQLARAVDDAGQPPGHGADHAGHGRQEEHRRQRQLDAVGDGIGV
jgi:hypothetical protein